MSSPVPPIVVAGHLAIDFVNSVATPHGERIDWLRDPGTGLDWFASLSVFPEAVLRKFERSVARGALEEAFSEARKFREWLRGKLPQAARLRGSPQITERLNTILSRGSAFYSVVKSDGTSALHEYERLENPDQLLVPIAKAIARLFTEEDLTRIRACAGVGCTLWFLDETKPGRRRFCSPEVCGNRAKVAAFRNRQRDAD